MREIFFRGKHDRCDGEPYLKEWIYGDLTHVRGIESLRYFMELSPGKDVEVHEETVGQYTNLNATNGDKIFEGDIVGGEGWAATAYGPVYFSNGCWHVDDELLCAVEDLKILGNIHDNPELLEEEK